MLHMPNAHNLIVGRRGKTIALQKLRSTYAYEHDDAVVDLSGMLILVKALTEQRVLLYIISSTDKPENTDFVGITQDVWRLARRVTGKPSLDVALATTDLRLCKDEYEKLLGLPVTMIVQRQLLTPEGGMDVVFRLEDPWRMHRESQLEVINMGSWHRCSPKPSAGPQQQHSTHEHLRPQPPQTPAIASNLTPDLLAKAAALRLPDDINYASAPKPASTTTTSSVAGLSSPCSSTTESCTPKATSSRRTPPMSSGGASTPSSVAGMNSVSTTPRSTVSALAIGVTAPSSSLRGALHTLSTLSSVQATHGASQQRPPPALTQHQQLSDWRLKQGQCVPGSLASSGYEFVDVESMDNSAVSASQGAVDPDTKAVVKVQAAAQVRLVANDLARAVQGLLALADTLDHL